METPESQPKIVEERYVRISVRSMVYVVLFVILIMGLFYIRDILYVFLTSIVVASFVESGVRKLKKRGVGRTISVLVIYSVVLSLIGVLMYLFVPIFLEQMVQFSEILHTVVPTTAVGGEGAVSFSGFFSDLEALATSASGGVVSTAIAVFGGLFNLILLVVLSFYLSMNKGGIETFLRIITPLRSANYVVGLWKRTERKLGLWFQGQLLLGLLVGVLTYLGLLIFNIKYALLLALVAGLFELIPFGIILAAIPAIAAGYSSNGSIGAIQVAGLYTVIQQFENNLIQPLIVQKIVGINSFIVILALLVGVKLAGFWGVMLSIPAAVLLMEFLEDIKKEKGLHVQQTQPTSAEKITVVTDNVTVVEKK